MSVKTVIRELVESVEGGIGAVVMGFDGIAIEEYVAVDAPIDVSLLAVEYVAVIREVKKTSDVLKIGQTEEISITTDYSRTIIRAIDEELFIVLSLTSDGNFGKARYLLKLNGPRIRDGLF